MIRCIIFDIDETLYSYSACHRISMKKLDDYCCENFDWDEGEMADLWKAGFAAVKERLGFHNAAIHDTMLRIQWALEQKGINPLPHAHHMHRLYWDTLLENMQPEKDVEAFLRTVRKHGILLGLNTDLTAEIQYRKLEKLGFSELFDFIVTSEEAGVEKPHERIFACCLEKAGCSAEECLMIGDNWNKDILGALDAGMQAAWYRPREKASDIPEDRRDLAFTGYMKLLETVIN